VERWFKSSSNEIAPKKKTTVGIEAGKEKVVEALPHDKVIAKRGTGGVKVRKKPGIAAKSNSKKTMKTLPTVVLDVILGRSKIALMDPKEQKKKRANDVVACGCLPKPNVSEGIQVLFICFNCQPLNKRIEHVTFRLVCCASSMFSEGCIVGFPASYLF
jgi:hypothetical protein